MSDIKGSSWPDLDWSQVRETVKLLTISVAQVEKSMAEGDESVNQLTGSFTSIVEHISAIEANLQMFETAEQRDQALQHCQAISEYMQSAIVAFQFYDRLQQCLQHVSHGLRGLSVLIDDPQRLYSPFEWQKFQDELRSMYSMESEKVMFDAILQGKSIDEAMALAADFAVEANKADDDAIELF